MKMGKAQGIVGDGIRCADTMQMCVLSPISLSKCDLYRVFETHSLLFFLQI